METLCCPFDAVARFSDLLDRNESKIQELNALSSTISIISGAVRDFAEDLSQEERASVFASNQVFPQLVAQLQRCEQVILGRDQAAKEADGLAALEDVLPPFPPPSALDDDRQQAHGQGGSILASGASRANAVVSAVKRGLRHNSRTFNEGLEMVSGRLGSISQTFLRLPEDELKVSVCVCVCVCRGDHHQAAAHRAEAHFREYLVGTSGSDCEDAPARFRGRRLVSQDLKV